MKKFFKWSAIAIGGLVLLAFIAGWLASEPVPEGKEGTQAEALARRLWDATGQPAWDTTAYVRWNFDDRRRYIWDQHRKLVQVEWPEHKVLLNTQTLDGKAWQESRLLERSDARATLDEAWKYFCNDSFWLNAPGKIYDPGTSRKAVQLDDGSAGLLVSYSSGGVTPGDSYLWILNDDGLPVKWKMWVSILPIGGLEATWEDWQTLPTGAKVATRHQVVSFESEVLDIQAGSNWAQVGLEKDPFGALQ